VAVFRHTASVGSPTRDPSVALTNRAIAERLFLSERAVERHVTSIFEKLGLSSVEGGHQRVLSVLAFLEQ
jgi:DNA-binding NarL/FixJ family response regulator